MTLVLPVKQTRKLDVKLGDGRSSSTLGKCTELEIWTGKFATVVDTYVLEFWDLYLILGAAWMKQFRRSHLTGIK